ncbi:MAG: GrdX family protein [Lachnospiraceae bacterium]|nr:GrdX family protein [Lachnospiraceae bacterium]
MKKTVLVTNNRKAREAFAGKCEILWKSSYEEVLQQVRDLVYAGYALLTHPQASSVKPNRTPVRSVLLSDERPDEETQLRDQMLMGNIIEQYRQWQAVQKPPEEETEAVLADYETVDLSMIEEAFAQMI